MTHPFEARPWGGCHNENVEGRNKEKARELADLGAVIVEMDVTNEESVNSAIQNALSSVGDIDVLVNNAGIGVSGRQVLKSDWQRLFGINVFGVQRVTRAILPHFRENEQNFDQHFEPSWKNDHSSRSLQCFKHALKAMTENYRMELSQFGISVALIEQVAFRPSFLEHYDPSDSAHEAFEEPHSTRVWRGLR